MLTIDRYRDKRLRDRALRWQRISLCLPLINIVTSGFETGLSVGEELRGDAGDKLEEEVDERKSRNEDDRLLEISPRKRLVLHLVARVVAEEKGGGGLGGCCEEGYGKTLAG